METPFIIAYYLPKFHSFKENDEWWGSGFTEWTNVKKAKPLFKGHYQPRIPSELGYYNLLDLEIRERQVDLARAAGIGGFCYWHYWFNGHQLMNRIIDEIVALGTPNFPFCIGWANESWSQKFWNKDSRTDKLLIEQTYGGLKDCRTHYLYARGLFENKNYIRINGKPFFLVYKPENLESNLYIDLWNKWIKEDGIADEIYFVCNLEDLTRIHQMERVGYSAITPGPNERVLKKYNSKSWLMSKFEHEKRKFFHSPILIDMTDVNDSILDTQFDIQEKVIPVLYPQWDHSPRSGGFVFIVENSTPEMFQKQVENAMDLIRMKDNKLLMLKSWNEWAEGNYMEPDQKYGRGFIEALNNGIKKYY